MYNTPNDQPSSALQPEKLHFKDVIFADAVQSRSSILVTNAGRVEETIRLTHPDMYALLCQPTTAVETMPTVEQVVSEQTLTSEPVFVSEAVQEPELAAPAVQEAYLDYVSQTAEPMPYDAERESRVRESALAVSQMYQDHPVTTPASFTTRYPRVQPSIQPTTMPQQTPGYNVVPQTWSEN